MAQITYSNKYAINENTGVAAANKVQAEDMNEIKEVVNTNTPAGLISMYAGSSAPTGWLICDGSAVSRTTYASLFTAIGTTYGTGDGSTTFNLPNLKGNVPVGYDDSQTEFNSLGKTGGSKYLQNHTHIIQDQGYGEGTAGDAFIFQKVSAKTSNYIKMSSEGNGNSGNLQPYIVMNYIISY